MRDAREARGDALAEVERVTRIRRRFLESIEASDWMALPDGPPSRGFIRIYARYLGMDADQCVAEFEAATGNVALVHHDEFIPPPPTPERPQAKRRRPNTPPAVQTEPQRPTRWNKALPSAEEAELDALAEAAPLPPRTARAAAQERVYRSLDELDAAEAALEADGDDAYAPEMAATAARVDAYDAASNPRGPGGSADPNTAPVITRLPPRRASGHAPTRAAARSPRPTPAWLAPSLIGGGALIALLLVGVLGVPALQKLLAPTATPTAVSVITPSAASVTAISPVATATQPPPTASATPVTTSRFTPRPGGGMAFTLDARERAWARITVEGATVFEGLPPIGPALSWTVTRTLTLETGNAAAFDAIVNGERLGPLGARDEVLRRIYDAAGTIRDERLP